MESKRMAVGIYPKYSREIERFRDELSAMTGGTFSISQAVVWGINTLGDKLPDPKPVKAIKVSGGGSRNTISINPNHRMIVAEYKRRIEIEYQVTLTYAEFMLLIARTAAPATR